MNSFIDVEISKRIGAPNMTWRKLEVCFKWRALQEFLRARGVPEGSENHALVRRLLQAQELTDVEYDAATRAIVRINHAECAALDGVKVSSAMVES